MTVVRRSRTIIFDLYGTLLPGGSRLQRDTIAFQMADVLEVDRKKFADVVRDTTSEYEGRWVVFQKRSRNLRNALEGHPLPDKLRWPQISVWSFPEIY